MTYALTLDQPTRREAIRRKAMTPKIEKNIPILKRKTKYPFGGMDLGDSVFYPNEPKASKSLPSVAAASYGSRYGQKFCSRTEGTGVRIWRVE